MLGVIRKAWEETFYPQFLAQGERVNFFDGIENPSFKYYFLEFPVPYGNQAYKFIYFLALGFLLFPLKNVFKAAFEFPALLVYFLLQELERHLAFIPAIKLWFVLPKIMSFLLYSSITLILSPSYGRYRMHQLIQEIPSYMQRFIHHFPNRIQQLMSNLPHRVQRIIDSYPITLLGSFLIDRFVTSRIRRNILQILFARFERRFPDLSDLVLPFLNVLHPLHIFFARLYFPQQKSQDKSLKFKNFEDFDPNKTRCSISNSLMGFSQQEMDCAHTTVMQYKENNVAKYALLTALLGAETKGSSSPLTLLNKADLISHFQQKYPSKNWVEVPPQLTQKFELSLQCPICLMNFSDTDLVNELPVRSIYGHYYTKEGIINWINKSFPPTCPITRLPLKLEDIKEIPRESISRGSLELERSEKPFPPVNLVSVLSEAIREENFDKSKSLSGTSFIKDSKASESLLPLVSSEITQHCFFKAGKPKFMDSYLPAFDLSRR